MGVTLNHPFIDGMFHENHPHPAIGDPPFMEPRGEWLWRPLDWGPPPPR